MFIQSILITFENKRKHFFLHRVAQDQKFENPKELFKIQIYKFKKGFRFILFLTTIIIMTNRYRT